MFFGVLLIALGLVGYFAPDLFGKVGDKGTSPTALIPAGIGAILFICGARASAKPKLRKHVMHLAVVIGLLGAIGGFMPLQRTKFNFEMASAVTGTLMVLLCGLFVVLCIRSFVLARIADRKDCPKRRIKRSGRRVRA